ncbi:MAG: tRNA epoxyqueuosine(34) reductase QueG [Rhizobiaceae bacterium]
MPAKAPALDAKALRQMIDREALRLGFDAVGVASAVITEDRALRLAQFVDNGWHGDMGWMAETLARRADPQVLWPAAKSVIMLAMNYGQDGDALENISKPDRANISVYARNRDYHSVVKGKLKELRDKLASASGKDAKVFVDTAPVMEKPLAAQAGLGWQGKHTNLVSRAHGSWFFLGAIFTEAELLPDMAETDHCGTCRACLDACPTNAFPAPYQLDARRCISYLTIEHNRPIPHDLRKAIGNRIYGCDDCLASCPWNKFAQSSREMKLKARADLISPSIAEFLDLNDAAFRVRFSASPVKRIGRAKFMRNVLIAAGNSGDGTLAGKVIVHIGDPDPLVRGAAIWALGELLGKAVALHHIPVNETDMSVVDELERLRI